MDPNIFHAQLAHDVMFCVEAVLAAALLTFLWIMAPYFRSGGPRR
jgi:hypothetical protein